MNGEIKETGDNSQVCAILAYLLIGIIWYFADKAMQANQFVKFHVKQGLILLFASLAWSIALHILIILTIRPAPFLWRIFSILSYVPFILAVIGIVNAINKKEQELPVIGKFASKLTF